MKTFITIETVTVNGNVRQIFKFADLESESFLNLLRLKFKTQGAFYAFLGIERSDAEAAGWGPEFDNFSLTGSFGNAVREEFKITKTVKTKKEELNIKNILALIEKSKA